MIQILRLIAIFCVLIVIAGYAFGAPSYMKGESNASVKIDKTAYGMTTFYCNAKLYHADIQLPKFQGCQSEDISFGPGGLDAKLLTVYYDWQDLPNKPKRAKMMTFIEKPDGELYRLKDTSFLTDPKLQQFFESAYGRGRGVYGESNLKLSDFSVRNIQSYGNTFCVNHYMKYPFSGTVGWCQFDRIVGGEITYLKGALTFSRAALLAQDYVNENNLKLRAGKLFHQETKVVLKTDKKGWKYWGFAVPAEHIAKLDSYGFRVYFNGTVLANEYKGLPTLEQL
ncbi:MAG: hypothetical protein ACI9TY_000019 [Alphaproteobacteria bacterium]|jgi:hypothetical protein